MKPNLCSTLVVEIVSTIKQMDEAHRRKPMELPGRGASYNPQLMVANKSLSYPRHDTPPSTTRVEDIHISTTDNTNVSSTTEARYTSRSPTYSSKAGDPKANTKLYHSCLDTDTEDALAAEKVTPTLPVQVQATELCTIEQTKKLSISEPLQDSKLVYKVGRPASKNDRYLLSYRYRDLEHGRKRLPISEPLQDNKLVYKVGRPASKNDRYLLSYRDPEHGRKVWVELAQRPGPTPGPAKMKERGEREEREKDEIPSNCKPKELGLVAIL